MKQAPLLHAALHSVLPFVVAVVFLGLSCTGTDRKAERHYGNADFEVWPAFEHTAYGWPLTAVRMFKVKNDLTIPGRYDFFGMLADLVAYLMVTGTLHLILFLISRPRKPVKR